MLKGHKLSSLELITILHLLMTFRDVYAAIDVDLLKVMLRDFRNVESLYAGAIGAVTVFGCHETTESRVKLTRELSRTFVTSSVLDIDEIKARLDRLAWEIGGRNSEDVPYDGHKQLFVLDLDCPPRDLEDFIHRANEERMFSSPFKWLMLLHRDNNDLEQARSLLDEADVYPDSDLVIWQPSSSTLISIYRTNPSNGSWQTELRGTWTKSNGLVLLNRDELTRRRKNLAGTHLKSCIVYNYPETLNHLTDYEDRHIDPTTKSNYPYALHLASMLNATVSFKTVTSWGYSTPNGSWDGMVGMLQRKEIDFGGTGIFLLRNRVGVVQYINLWTETISHFIFRSPPLSSTSNLFRLPFGNSVWLGILGLIILLVGLLYPAMRLEWIQWRNRDHQLEPRLPNLSDDMLVVVGAVSQQGAWYEPRAGSTRIIFLMALLAAVVLSAAYTANIVALLTSTTSSIKTLKDLLNSHLNLLVYDTVYNRYYFGNFKDPVRHAIAKKVTWVDIEEGVQRVRSGCCAFHVETGGAYKVVQETFEEYEKCGFQEINYLNFYYPTYIVQRRSPYLDLLRVGALRLHEIGLRGRENSRIFTKKPMCTSSRQFLSVGLTECYGAFLALVYGHLLGLAFFIFETIVGKIRRRKQRIDTASASTSKSASASVNDGPLE